MVKEIFSLIIFILFFSSLNAALINQCSPSIAQTDLDINNVRAKILAGGDMWWDLNAPKYEIPKGSGKLSIFNGGLWIGGVDGAGQLKMAAMTYRQSGVDFWPGPLDTVSASVFDSVCHLYDRHWKLNRWEVDQFRQNYNNPGYIIPEAILSWPAHGDVSKGQSNYLAPFNDANGDGIYNPFDGDSPAFNINGAPACYGNLHGDQNLFWIFNDNGNVHSETIGPPMGLEIHAQAFAFHTRDENDNNTFYQYKIINRSNSALNDFYFGLRVDVDLGNYADDFVGCDVMRGLGFGYNGVASDGTGLGWEYGLHPPAVGIDFLDGLQANSGDGIDNDRDNIVDEAGEKIPTSVFKYYNGGSGNPWGQPYSAQEYYYVLKGLLLDGTPTLYSFNPSVTTTWMFPDSSDPSGYATGGVPQPAWSEFTNGNTPSDRRFVISSGPSALLPGQVQMITSATVWGRDMNGDHIDGVMAMKASDDKAQQLFDNCFQQPCFQPFDTFTFTASGNELFFAYPYSNGLNFQWDFGDGSTSGSAFPSHLYASPGKYLVCLSVTNGCGVSNFCDSVLVGTLPGFPAPSIRRFEGKGNGGNDLLMKQSDINTAVSGFPHRSLFPFYEPRRGPVLVEVLNPDSLKNGDYRIRFDSVSAAGRWKAYRVGLTDTVYSDSTIVAGEVKYIPSWGIRISVRQVNDPATTGSVRNGFLSSSVSFTDTTQKLDTPHPLVTERHTRYFPGDA